MIDTGGADSYTINLVVPEEPRIAPRNAPGIALGNAMSDASSSQNSPQASHPNVLHYLNLKDTLPTEMPPPPSAGPTIENARTATIPPSNMNDPSPIETSPQGDGPRREEMPGEVSEPPPTGQNIMD